MIINSEKIDRSISGYMNRHGIKALQISLAVIFIWFGLLKILGISPAAGLVKATVNWMPFFDSDSWVKIIGCWEVVIGVCFIFKKTLRVAIALLAMQMVGTFLPLVILPDITFQRGMFPFAPTIEGQYIIKNLLIIAAALTIGGTVRNK
ncbi:MAG: hypothetical protein M3R36_00970 [Bacteroidota bacterium]|nr:hypothetical protein [Bacteroidota bacterium]